MKGTLYGPTYVGGTFDASTVLALEASSGTETVLHWFGGGTHAVWHHVAGGDGCKYDQCGTVFAIKKP